MTVRLPAVIRAYDNALAYVVAWTPFIFTYEVLNHWPLRTPQELPFTPLDRVIPFVPELIVVYVMYIPLFWWTGFRSENDLVANRFFYATHVQLLLSIPFYLFFPVRMPRELFYPDQAYNFADAFWRWFDAPNNCFPSLHVSNCLMFMHFNAARPGARIVNAFTVLVMATTVLVKQHYVVDVVGGVVVYILARWVMRRVHVAGMDAHASRSERQLA